MSGCAAIGCSNRGDKGFSMKSFPRDPERRALWASQMKRDNWQPNNNSRLCEAHFDNDQWEKIRQDGTRKLKCNAIPTLFQCSTQLLKRKREKSEFIVPLRMEVASALNSSLIAMSTTLATIDQCSKDSKQRIFASDVGKQIVSPVVSRIECASVVPAILKLNRKSTNLVSQTKSNSIERQNFTSQDVNAHQSDPREVNTLKNCVKTTKSFSCSAKNCNRQLKSCQSESSFYMFPLDNSALLKEWLKVCEKGWRPSTESMICKKHFASDCFDSSGFLLKNTAIPTLLQDHNCAEIRNPRLRVRRKTEYNEGCRRPDLVTSSDFSDNLNLPIEGNGMDAIYCRLCARRQDGSYIPIFGESDLAEKISRCLPIMVLPTDNLPLYICSKCLYHVDISHKLIIRSLRADNFLRSKFAQTNPSQGSERSMKSMSKEFDNRTIESYAREEPVFQINGPIECDLCKDVFQDMNVFDRHVETVHLLQWRCSLCDHSFANSQELLAHKTLNHSGQISTCKSCASTPSVEELDTEVPELKHEKEMFDAPCDTMYKCLTCPKKFVDKALYQKHRNVHDPACWHKFRCNICNRSFMDKFKLSIHQSIHNGIKPYQCDVCGRMFNRNANMVRHRVKHFEQVCRHCEKVFANTRSLGEHLKDIHGDTLSGKHTSKAVIRRNTDEIEATVSVDNFMCGYCGKQLTSYYSLRDHERIHTGDKPYVCHHCGKAFRSITARWDHMVRHEKGNYICELCGKSMSNKLNLSSHLRRHAAIEQRRFECRECGKLFHVRWKLKAHLIRVHRSELPN